MTNAPGDSSYDLLLIDRYNYREDKYCYFVLQELLKKYNAVIRQRNGIFEIFRPKELTGTTVYGRHFTSASTKSSTSMTPLQYINRSSHITDYEQLPGGIVMPVAPLKLITTNQDLGYKESWIDTWELNSKQIIINPPPATSSDFNDWTRSAGCTIAPVTNAGETDGMMITSFDSVAPGAKYIYQEFGDFAVLTSDVIIFEVDFLTYNANTSTEAVNAFIEIKNTGNNYYLHLS